MAKIGVNNFRYGILSETADGVPSYSGAKTPALAISCNVDITNNDAKLFADDHLAESDSSFQQGTVTMGIDDEDLEVQADLLGHTYSSGEIIRKATDTAPYVGFGRIITKMKNGTYKYKVEFLYKVKFAEPSQENETKGETIEFGTSEITGTIHTLNDTGGTWSKAKTFATKSEALTYLTGLLNSVFSVESFISAGTATLTLAHTPTEIQAVIVEGTKLAESAYSFSGTTLTLASAPTEGDTVIVEYTYLNS